MSGPFGYDTASILTSTLVGGANAQFNNGSKIAQWVARYFSPAPNTTLNSSQSNAINECRAAWDGGLAHIVPISSPSQSRLATSGSTGAAYGTADANTFASAIQNATTYVSTLHLPVGNELYAYLDVEAATHLTSNYWDAWAATLDGYRFTNGTYPLFPSAYVNPPSGFACGIVSVYGFAVWSSEPETCSNCAPFNAPAFVPNNCSSPPTQLWQMMERASNGHCASPCSGVINQNVDLDMATNSGAPLNNMLYLSSRP